MTISNNIQTLKASEHHKAILAPNNFYLFPTLNEYLKGCKFSRDKLLEEREAMFWYSRISRVSNRSAGMISSRFSGDIFTKIQQNLQFYRHLPGRVTNPLNHTDPVYPSNSSVKGHLLGIDSPNIN